MKHKTEKSCGSFTAWGTGFNYEYDSNVKKLEIFHARTGSTLIYIDFDKQLSQDPAAFVAMLDKSCQIRALTLSNNTSIDLSETFEDQKLTPVLADTARLARYGFDLMHDNFDRFERYFCQDNTIQNMKIRRVRKYEAGSAFYSAQIETRQSNKVTVESPTLHGAMSKLSQKIVQDLIARELTSNFDVFAHTLLKTSSKVSILALILNEKFLPSCRLKEVHKERKSNLNEIIH